MQGHNVFKCQTAVPIS